MVVLQVGVGLGSRLRAQGNKWKLFKSLFQCQPLHSAPCCLLELSLAVLWPFLFSGSDDSLSWLCVALISVMSACCKTYPCADLSPKDPAHSFLFLQLWWTTILSQTFLTHFLITWLSVCKWSLYHWLFLSFKPQVSDTHFSLFLSCCCCFFFFKCYVSIIFFSPVYFYIFELTCATLMWKSKSLHLRRAKNLKAEYWLHLTLDGHVFCKSHNNISKILLLKMERCCKKLFTPFPIS